MYILNYINLLKTVIVTGTPVSVALGDHQCAVMSTLFDASTDIVLNVSTSAEMSFVMPEGNKTFTNIYLL